MAKRQSRERGQDEALVKRSSEALADWEQQEAAHAKAVRSNATLGVARISTKGAEFKIDGKALGKTLVVLPVAMAKEKNYFERPYDPQRVATPDCYSFTEDSNKEEMMVAHAAAPDRQNLQPDGTSPCRGCKWNAFHTAKVGKGKRCKDYMRWMVITPLRDKDTGEWFLDPTAVRAAEKRLLQIPPSSRRNHDHYVDGLKDPTRTRTGSPREMIVQLDIYSLSQGGHGIQFTPLRGVDKPTHEAIIVVGNAALETLTQPYPVIDDDTPEQKPRSAKANKKLD